MRTPVPRAAAIWSVLVTAAALVGGLGGPAAASEPVQPEPQVSALDVAAEEQPESDERAILYMAHVQNIGWMDVMLDGETAGTTSALRLEAIAMDLDGPDDGSTINFQVAVRGYGWSPVATNGDGMGTIGEGRPIEAVRMSLGGPIAETHEVWYRTHVHGIGWMGWAHGNAKSGTVHSNLHATALEVVLLPKDFTAPGSEAMPYLHPRIDYRSHVQSIGWQGRVSNGATSGTSGESLRVEGFSASVTGLPPGLDFPVSLAYSAHVQNIGWQSGVTDGRNAGTTGRSLRVEALRFRLTSDHFDVYYRVHVQNHGWLAWTSNGSAAGSQGLGLRVEAYELKLVPKGVAGPRSEGLAFLYRPL
jgi:uncharacterized protein YjdB